MSVTDSLPDPGSFSFLCFLSHKDCLQYDIFIFSRVTSGREGVRCKDALSGMTMCRKVLAIGQMEQGWGCSSMAPCLTSSRPWVQFPPAPPNPVLEKKKCGLTRSDHKVAHKTPPETQGKHWVTAGLSWFPGDLTVNQESRLIYMGDENKMTAKRWRANFHEYLNQPHHSSTAKPTPLSVK